MAVKLFKYLLVFGVGNVDGRVLKVTKNIG